MLAHQTFRWSVATTFLLVLVLLIIGVSVAPGVAQAQSQDACTLETIAGTYLFHGEGVTVSEGKVMPYAEAGVATFDGKGNTEGVISASTNGEPFATRQATTATYEHVGNCVYTVVDSLGFTVDLYTTPAGTPMTYYGPGFSGVHLKQ